MTNGTFRKRVNKEQTDDLNPKAFQSSIQPTLPDGSVPKACQNVTGVGHCVNPIRAGVREIGNLLSSAPGMYGNNEYKPIGMPDVYVGALMKFLGRCSFDTGFNPTPWITTRMGHGRFVRANAAARVVSQRGTEQKENTRQHGGRGKVGQKCEKTSKICQLGGGWEAVGQETKHC